MADVDGVRSYDRIRRYLRQIYLYGCLSREDFVRLGIGGAKDYDFGTRLIRSIFPDSQETACWQEGKKYLRIQREYARSGENRMTDSYLLHTLDTETELPMLLYLLSVLAGEEGGPGELNRAVQLLWPDDQDRYATLRKRLLDFQREGYALCRGGRYSLAPDALRELSDQALLELCDFAGFAAGISYPAVPGSYLRRTVERELLRRGLEPGAERPLLLRHCAHANVFDEELVFQLLEAIRRRKWVSLQEEKAQRRVLPVALRADVRLGRWYLLLWEEGPRLCRLRDIRKLKELETAEEAEAQALSRQVLEAFARSGVSGALPEQGPTLVEAKLCFGDFSGMRAQFLRELRLGEVVTREDGEYYTVRINDPRELMPFLRSYAPWLRVLPGPHGLEKVLQESLLAMGQSLETEVAHGAAE